MGNRPDNAALGQHAIAAHRLFEKVRDGRRDPDLIRYWLQRLTDGQMPDHEGPCRYVDKLAHIRQQLRWLHIFNQEVWGDYFMSEQLSTINEKVSVDAHDEYDYSLIHVQFATDAETIRKWWAVIRWLFPEVKFGAEAALDPQCLRAHPQSMQYKPGLHLVRFDWAGDFHTSLERAPLGRRQTLADRIANIKPSDGRVPAGTPVLPFVAYNPWQLALMDGNNLPFLLLPGLEVSEPTSSEPNRWDRVPSLMYGPNNGPVFGIQRITDIAWHFALPAIRTSG